jgi:hypothetical protein
MRVLSKPIRACLGVVLGITCAASLHAATATFQQGVNGYTGTADTDLNATEPDRVQGNDTAVLVDQNAPIAYGLIRFDNIFGTGPGQVPPTATITSATLTFVTSNVGDPIFGFRLLVPFDEATSTYNTMVNGVSIADGELFETSDFTLQGTAVGEVDTVDVTATVQGWFAGTFPNHGWGMTNSVGDGWQFNSSEAATVANRPVLTIVFDAPCSPISIVTQPAAVTVDELGSATFSVAVSGTDPVYQWFKDGSPIPDATNATYAISRVFRADEGNYSVSISNPCSGPINSVNAFLNVIEDVTAPRLACVFGTNDQFTIFVQFSEIVTNAADPVNYSFFPTSDPSSPLQIASAVYPGGATEGNVVVLTLDPSTPWVAPTSYSISAGAVFDLVGNPNDPAQVLEVALYDETIFTLDKTWAYRDPRADLPPEWKTPGYNDSDWTNGPALLGVEGAALPAPGLQTTLVLGGITYYFRTHFNYSGPAGTGVLRFRTVLDDSAIIYLNGVEIRRIRMPAGPVTYLTEGAGGAVGDATLEGPYTVCVTNLVAGDNVIAVELHQIGTGSSDFVWGMDLASVTDSIDPVAIVTQPVGTNVMEPAPFTLRVVATGSAPQYQWFRNGTAIPDATNSTYTVSSSRCAADAGNYHVVVQNAAPSTVTSSTVTVNVACDTAAPVVSCLYGTNDVIVVVFNEVTTNGTDVFSYQIEPIAGGPALALSSATYTSGTNVGTTALLVIDPSTPRDPNAAYRITISGIADLFGNNMSPTTIDIPLFPSAPIFPITSTWRYNTTGTDLSNTWYSTSYDASAWPQGAAPFDAKRPVRTEVGGYTIGTQTTLSNAAGTAQIPTHYFRMNFNYSGPATATLQFKSLLDDGAVFYLNGVEILRVRLPNPPAPILYSTLANDTVGDATNELFFACVNNLVNGSNLLAVELHNQSLTSSDLTFATEISTMGITSPPRLTITRGPGANEVTVTWTGGGVLQQSSSLNTHPTSGWSDVSGVTGNSYTTTATGNRFFRLRP